MRRADKRWVQLRAQQIALAHVRDSLDAPLIGLDALSAGLNADDDVLAEDAAGIAVVLAHELRDWLANRFS